MSIEFSRIASKRPVANVHPLKDVRELSTGRSRLKPKELVDLLLCHGARAWRASQPVSRSRIKVGGFQGAIPVSMHMPPKS